MTTERWTAIFAVVIGGCANRPAASDDPARYEPTVQVVEPKPTYTPDFTTRETRSPAVSAEMFTCSDSADCVVLETGCCDHCNGGALLAVNGAFSEAAVDAFRQRSCDEAACTKMTCEWTYTPVCDAGTCARVEERPLGTAAATIVVVHNAEE